MEQGKRLASHVLIGVAAGVVIMIGLSAASAWVVAGEKLSEESIPIFGAIVFAVSQFLGMRLTIRMEQQRTLICAVLTGAGIFSVIMIFKLLWFPGVSGAAWWFAVLGICAIIGAAMLPTRFMVKNRKR